MFLGDFNPKIFQPAWFAGEGLIRKNEAEEANIEIIRSEIVVFSLEWLRLQVTQNRFIALTNHEPYEEILRDLVLGTFTLLRHTPLDKLGINVEKHFRMESVDAWHAFGHRLAPKEPWEGIIDTPGMRSLIMEGKRPDGVKGYVRVQVEPSARINPGVYVKVNDHYEIDTEPGAGTTGIVALLEGSWDKSIKRSETIMNALLETS